ncbi:methyltransferase domain-containing protein [Lapillicoccus sp.]|uniref:methyltransferase domain-containing protein n=1 Tax=Lapillicoccus sp. TaxID=1909287 RepID=UPI0025F868E1|nr:methyltransferase domain-containing protein [Lapillicoccus sp.]
MGSPPEPPVEPVELVPVERSARAVLEHLGQLYRHDLSEAYQLLPNPDGTFNFRELDRFRTGDDEGARAWLVHVAGRLGGFALIASTPDGGRSVAAFFVVRALRRSGVGRAAARLLLTQHVGRWTIGFQDYNTGVEASWTSIATEAVGTRWTTRSQPVPVEGVPPDTLLTFDTGPEVASPPPRGLTFGPAAEQYERYRPGYPQEVVDLVLTTDGRPLTTAIEIGAGTGKATRLIAAQGVAVLAVEPDPLMRAVLTRVTAGLPVTVVGSTLETLPSEVAAHPVDLLYAAAAWHWTDPATRWEQAARLLVEGGTFASFGGPMNLLDRDLVAQVEGVRAQFMQTDDVPPPRGDPATSQLHWPGAELVVSPYFTDVEEHDLPSTSTMTADDFVGLLSTVSAYLILPRATAAPSSRASGSSCRPRSRCAGTSSSTAPAGRTCPSLRELPAALPSALPSADVRARAARTPDGGGRCRWSPQAAGVTMVR